MRRTQFLCLEGVVRRHLPILSLVFLALGITAAIGLGACGERTSFGGQALSGPRDRMGLPRVMFWAWKRPENMRFLNSRRAGVAFLAGTIEIRSASAAKTRTKAASFVLKPRVQPLLVPPGTALMAVVRIETPNDLWHHPPGWRGSGAGDSATSLYSVEQRRRVAGMIVSLARLRGVRAMQVDYDATESEQPFYRRLLMAVRRRLPARMPLSMTALASWCIGDAWLNSLPPGTVDEAVPMLFRMGPDASGVEGFVESGQKFRASVCRGSLGVSTDETFSRRLLTGGLPRTDHGAKPRRIYVFSNRVWTEARVKRILSEVDQWDVASRRPR